MLFSYVSNNLDWTLTLFERLKGAKETIHNIQKQENRSCLINHLFVNHTKTSNVETCQHFIDVCYLSHIHLISVEIDILRRCLILIRLLKNQNMAYKHIIIQYFNRIYNTAGSNMNAYNIWYVRTWAWFFTFTLSTRRLGKTFHVM